MTTASRILFSGRVQGVGFRQTTVSLSRDLSLAGSVCNLGSGQVELIVEGPAADIHTLVTRLQARFGGFITGVVQSPASVRGLPAGIRIVH